MVFNIRKFHDRRANLITLVAKYYGDKYQVEVMKHRISAFSPTFDISNSSGLQNQNLKTQSSKRILLSKYLECKRKIFYENTSKQLFRTALIFIDIDIIELDYEK